MSVISHHCVLKSRARLSPLILPLERYLIASVVGRLRGRIDTLVPVQDLGFRQTGKNIIRHPLSPIHLVPDGHYLAARTAAPAVRDLPRRLVCVGRDPWPPPPVICLVAE